MKRVIFIIIFVSICGIINTGCKKEIYYKLNGNFSGTVTTTCKGTCESWFEIGTTTTTINFDNGRFTCSGSPTKILTKGSGTYSVDNDRFMIIFEQDSEYFPGTDGNSDDFDGLRLVGEFNYTINAKKNTLKLTQTWDGVYSWEFDLEKN